MLRRAAPTALRDPQAGAPGLLNVPYSTFAGASVARGATHSDRSFRRFATTWCEKSGLVSRPDHASSGLETCMRERWSRLTQIDTTRPEMTFCVKKAGFPLSDQILELSGKSS